MPTPNGFTALTATRIQDALGNLLTGLLLVTATDANDVPLAAVAGGAGGAIVTAAEAPFTNGVLAPNTWVPDSALTTNPNTSYRFTFLRPDGSIWRIWRGVQPTGLTLNLDTYQPNVAPQAVLQYGPQGPAGSLVIGAVTGLPFGAMPTVTNVGTAHAAVLNLGIPAGAPGSTGGALTIFSQVPSGAIDGSNTVFTLGVAPVLLLLTHERVMQTPILDYTLSGTTITYTQAPLPGDTHYAQGIY